MSTLLNISGKIDPETVIVFEKVDQVTTELNMPYVVVGATARDIVLHYGHGAVIQRATSDVDFAIEVPNWSAYKSLKERLCEQGYRAHHAHQRLISPANAVIDVVPFGGVSENQDSISWPPDGKVKMNVLGFQEACNTAEWVRIRNKPELDIPVATPAGMMLLKLIAWTDRPGHLRKKDALDIAYLLNTYEAIKETQDALYDDHSQVLETYDWDLKKAAAHLLGVHTNQIALKNTYNKIMTFAAGEVDKPAQDQLIEDMCEHIDIEYDNNHQLLSAFMRGFRK